MKKFVALLIISSSFWACSKESSTTTNNNNNATDSVRYVVNTTNAQNWSGYYLDENNQKIAITSQGTGWQISFINKASKPRALELSATSSGINPTDSFTIETKIYTNGNFVGFYFIKGTGNKPETCTSKYTMN
jgi:putative methionine-R-sulfoxide reductase with GAF domain